MCEGADVRRVLDVGCGTGIASQLFLDRGCEVVGVEPDERMAAVARRRGVSVVVAPFETFSPPAEPFDVVASAQAWHWVDQDIGPARAADALRQGGRLALISNGYERGRFGTSSAPCTASTHPSSSTRRSCSADPPYRSEKRTQPRSRPVDALAPSTSGRSLGNDTYTRDEWLDQLPTHSDHRTLAPRPARPPPRAHRRGDRRERRRATIGHTTELRRLRRRPGAPKSSRRPPNAIEHTASHAHPSAMPAKTSVNQWTPSITRVPATSTARPAATPAMTLRTGARPTATGEQRDHHERWPRRPQRVLRGTTQAREPRAAGRSPGRSRLDHDLHDVRDPRTGRPP